jgi:hypothetical protein
MQPRLNYHSSRRPEPKKPTHSFLPPWLAVPLVLIAAAVVLHLFRGHAAASNAPVIRSGNSGYCLDVRSGGTTLDSWNCNHTQAQAWNINQDSVSQGSQCLSVKDNIKGIGASVITSTCNNEPGQIWLKDNGGLYNPNSGLCLSASPNQKATIELCHQPNDANQIWTSSDPTKVNCAKGSRGQKVACFAETEWEAWQAGTPSHESLLNTYTDGAPYEQWCADFVSYVYKEAGYPFTGGEADGWDESNANNVQNMGYTMHDPASYTPNPGDVAYFNYSGGHVEIVVSAGKTPTFIYGDSARIDPATGNGQMEANTITSDGPQGQLMYYLSPN